MKTAAVPKRTTFTLEDIRRLRYWCSERYSDMTHQEIVDDINDGARGFMELIESARCGLDNE